MFFTTIYHHLPQNFKKKKNSPNRSGTFTGCSGDFFECPGVVPWVNSPPGARESTNFFPKLPQKISRAVRTDTQRSSSTPYPRCDRLVSVATAQKCFGLTQGSASGSSSRTSPSPGLLFSFQFWRNRKLLELHQKNWPKMSLQSV